VTFAARASASARRLVRYFSGPTLKLSRVVTGALAADRSVTTTTTTATVRCTHPTPYGQRLRDGERVLDGDLRVLVWRDDPALPFAPAAEMRAELDGDSYSVVAVERHAGAYELQLRGGGA